ncbi:MAG: hypothetical protein K2H53_03905 [Clostridia bacterium]|nr:hypothetical protein [Clostridia bacterium]
MKDKNEAEELSHIMKKLGELSEIETNCIITNMDQPIRKSYSEILWKLKKQKMH